ncbi:MAG: YHYH protein, partial [Acidobacteriota bacterium]
MLAKTSRKKISSRNWIILSTLFAAAIFAAVLGCGSVATGSSSGGGTTTGGGGGTTTTGWTGGGDGVWRRNAVYAETATFDPCNAHQPGSGEYHYHDDPICLRYQLNDNITGSNVGTATATYTESTGTHTHSPILGWSFDGYPVYGPYGYSSPTSSTSGVRRMVSSYAIRTDNTTTRTSLPAWAQTYQSLTTLTAAQYGPAV